MADKKHDAKADSDKQDKRPKDAGKGAKGAKGGKGDKPSKSAKRQATQAHPLRVDLMPRAVPQAAGLLVNMDTHAR